MSFEVFPQKYVQHLALAIMCLEICLCMRQILAKNLLDQSSDSLSYNFKETIIHHLSQAMS